MNVDYDGYVATAAFAASYGLSLGRAALIAKLTTFLTAVAPYVIIAKVVAAYEKLLKYIEMVIMVIIMV